VEVAKKRLLVRLKLPMGVAHSLEQGTIDHQAEQRSSFSTSTPPIPAPTYNDPARGCSMPLSTTAVTGVLNVSGTSQHGALLRYNSPPVTAMVGAVGKPIQSSPLLKLADFVAERPCTPREYEILRTEIRNFWETESSTHSGKPDDLSGDLGGQRTVAHNSQASSSSTLSHITVNPRNPKTVTTVKRGLPRVGLTDDSSQEREKHGRKSKKLTNETIEPPLKKRKVSEQPWVKQVTAINPTPESDTDEDIPLIQLMRQRKRKLLTPTDDTDEDVPLINRKLRPQCTASQRRLRTKPLDDKEIVSVVPVYEYSTRAKAGIQSKESSSSTTKPKEIVYDSILDVDIETAIFPVKVRHPSQPGTLWEIKKVEDLCEEIDRSRLLRKPQPPPRIQAGFEGHDRPKSGWVSGARPNPLVIFMDQAEKEFGNSLFFIISSAKHCINRPITFEDGKIVDEAAQAWLDTLRRGRVDFEEKIRPLGLLGRGFKTLDEAQHAGNGNQTGAGGSTKEEKNVPAASNETMRDGIQKTMAADSDPSATVFETIREHLQLIPQIAKDKNIHQKEKMARVHASLLVVGDFIESRYTDPKELDERLRLWAYFGYKSFSASEGDMGRAAKIREAYKQRKSEHEAKEEVDGSAAREQSRERKQGLRQVETLRQVDQTRREEDLTTEEGPQRKEDLEQSIEGGESGNQEAGMPSSAIKMNRGQGHKRSRAVIDLTETDDEETE
jgi:hypothetical protein